MLDMTHIGADRAIGADLAPDSIVWLAVRLKTTFAR